MTNIIIDTYIIILIMRIAAYALAKQSKSRINQKMTNNNNRGYEV